MKWTAIGLSIAAYVCVSSLACAGEPTPASTSDAVDGERVYQTYCYQCHGTGWSGAPLSGEKQDWQARIAAGMDAMLKNSKQGLNAMPPKGTCTQCSDAQLQAAIQLMLQFD